MSDDGGRRPGAVPDDEGGGARDAGVLDVHPGVDTDGDGLPDTVLDADGADLLVLTDLDGDELADRVLRIGPDGAVHAGSPPGTPGAVGNGIEAGNEPGPDRAGGPPGPASDAPGWWAGLWGAPSGPVG